MYHVIPSGDLIEHDTSVDCECRPTKDLSSGLVIHNALDNREFDEIAAEIDGR